MAIMRRAERSALRSNPRRCGAVLLAAAILGAPLQAQAQQPQSAPEARVIVTGEGSVTVPPDYAQIRSGVTTRANTARAATDANSKLMAAVTAALLDAGVAQKDIQTSQFSVQPIYVQQTNAEAKLTGFSVSNQISVDIRQLDKLGEVLDRLVTAGATDVGNIAFLHADTSKVLDQAREGAIADARRKAEIYAHAAGVNLGGVTWITEEPAYQPPLPMGAMRAAAPASVPIAVGQDTLQVRVTVGFDIAH